MTAPEITTDLRRPSRPPASHVTFDPHDAAGAPLPPAGGAVPRFGPERRAAFDARVRSGRPAVLTGVSGEWPAARTWSLERLGRYFGERRLPVARLQGGVLSYGRGKGLDYAEMTFPQFAETLESEGPARWYLTLPVAEHCPELLDDVRIPPWCDGAAWRASRLWVGPAGTTTPIHVELTHNLLAQIRGRKRISLYRLRETPRLYPNSPWSAVPHYSRVDPLRPDLGRFPRFAATRPYTCEIGAGEMLFIPRGWWHVVTALEPSVSFNFWWADGAWSLVPRLAAWLFKRIRGVRV